MNAKKWSAKTLVQFTFEIATGKLMAQRFTITRPDAEVAEFIIQHGDMIRVISLRPAQHAV